MRVLVRKEATGPSTWTYVAICLEEFVANQGHADGNWLEVVDGLGEMLDLRDRMEPVYLPTAPPDIVAAWEKAMPIGERVIDGRLVALRMGAPVTWMRPSQDAWPEPASGSWDPEQKCWLVWEQQHDGKMYLRAVCTQLERAVRCVTQLKYDARKRSVVGDPVIEEARINHFFGSQGL